MLLTRAYDTDSLSSRNGRYPLSRRNSTTSECKWMGFHSQVPTLPSDDDEAQPVSSTARIRINVSGAVFETYRKTLQRFPNTLLGSSQYLSEYYREDTDEYFFDRNRQAFESILYFYQSSGKLIKPANVGAKLFKEELKFFKIGEDLTHCYKEKVRDIEDEEAKDNPRGNYRAKIWNFLEHPRSPLALAFAGLSMSIILTSVVLFCLETIKTFQKSYEKWVFQRIEMFCVAWFTMELILRFATSPLKLKFVKSFFNIIDFLSVLPFYITLLSLLLFRGRKSTPLAFLRVIRLVRVLRILKLSRHMRVMKILGMTFKSSVNELFLLLFFVIIAVIIFSSSVYYADGSFSSIPDAFWWAIITLTNVGYGDAVPVTWQGKIIGSLCAICGLIVLALPMPIVVSSFMYFYSIDKENRKLERLERTEENLRKNSEAAETPENTPNKLFRTGRVSPGDVLSQSSTPSSCS